MAPKLHQRWVRRGMTSALVWAMVPLAIISGAPVARCGCANCRDRNWSFGAACAADVTLFAGCCNTARVALRDNPSDSRSTPAAGLPSNSRSCCGDQRPVACRHGNSNPSGKGNPDRPQRCQTLLTIRPAVVQPTASVPDGTCLVAAQLLPVGRAAGLPQAFDRIERIDSGPPIDLVVTLRHLLI
jgi:hypothetical protein